MRSLDPGAGGSHSRQVSQRPRPLDWAARPEASLTQTTYTGSGVRCEAIDADRRSFSGKTPTLHEAARIGNRLLRQEAPM